jgi:hypothetical protein
MARFIIDGIKEMKSMGRLLCPVCILCFRPYTYILILLGHSSAIENEEFADRTDFQLRNFNYPV